MRPQDLLAQVADFARATPTPTVEALCHALDQLAEDAGPDERLSVAREVQEPNARQAARALLKNWVGVGPEANPSSLSWALRAASMVDDQARHERELELVWTGPATQQMRLRRTEQVLLELIQSATSSLLLVTYVAFDISRVVEALVEARERGVPVRLVVETPETSGGKMTMTATAPLQRVIQAGGSVFVWPLEKRGRVDDSYGCLHVKCCVADDRRALISSANLTGHALNLNMELGVLISGGELPREVSRHFDSLAAEGVLRETPVATA